MAYICNALVVLPKMEDLDQLQDAVNPFIRSWSALWIAYPLWGVKILHAHLPQSLMGHLLSAVDTRNKATQ